MKKKKIVQFIIFVDYLCKKTRKIKKKKKWYFVSKIVRKNCSSDRTKLLKFETEGRIF